MVNTQNLTVFKWEASNGVASIVAADTPCHVFGEYNEDIRVNPPSIQQKISEAHTGASRAPIHFQGGQTLPVWKHQFHPVNCIPEYMFLGSINTAGTNPIISVKETGLKHSFTSRWEYKGGTNPRLIQSVGNYTVGFYTDIAIDKPQLVEITQAWQKYETEDDRDILTVSPTYPKSIDSSYYGLYDLEWDGNAWGDVFQIEFVQLQQFTSSRPTNKTQNIYPQLFQSCDVSFHQVISQNEQWDALKIGDVVDVTFKLYRAGDSAKWKKYTLKDVCIERIIDTHIAYNAHVISIVQGKSTGFTVEFVDEFAGDIDDYFPPYT
jgi:hypothetical protein